MVSPWTRLFSIGATLLGPTICLGAIVLVNRRLDGSNPARRMATIAFTLLFVAQLGELIVPWMFRSRPGAGPLPYVLRPMAMCLSYVAYGFLLKAVFVGIQKRADAEVKTSLLPSSGSADTESPYAPPRR